MDEDEHKISVAVKNNAGNSLASWQLNSSNFRFEMHAKNINDQLFEHVRHITSGSEVRIVQGRM